jgi:hypothetical protein
MKPSMVAYHVQRIQHPPRGTRELRGDAIAFLKDRKHLFSSYALATRAITALHYSKRSFTVAELRAMIMETSIHTGGKILIGPLDAIRGMGVTTYIELRRVIMEDC